MKNFFLKIVFFLTPFLFLSLIIFLVDPYNLFNFSHIFPNELKYKCVTRNNKVAPRGETLWKILDFSRDPVPNILLSDSRMEQISDSSLSSFFGADSKNLGITGASYETIIQMFWMANNSIKLKNVIIQVDFFTYNANINNKLYEQAIDIIQNKIKYFYNKYFLFDSFFIIYYSITHDNNLINKRYSPHIKSWEISKDLLTNFLSKKYAYPHNYYNGLMKISDYCKKHNINLVFLIPPTYSEGLSFIKEFDRTKEYLRFKKDFKLLGPTIDLDSGISLSHKKEYFFDFVHLKPQYIDTVLYLMNEYQYIRSNTVQ